MQTQFSAGASNSLRSPRRLAFRFALVALAMGLVLLIQGAHTHSTFADDCDSDATAVEECSVVVQPTTTATVSTGNVISAATVTIPPASRMWIHTDRKFAQAYDSIQVCWQLPAAGMYQIVDETSDGNRTVIASGFGDGSSSCLNGFITPPFGRECMRLVYTPLTGFRVALSTAAFSTLPSIPALTCFFTNG